MSTEYVSISGLRMPKDPLEKNMKRKRCFGLALPEMRRPILFLHAVYTITAVFTLDLHSISVLPSRQSTKLEKLPEDGRK